MQVLKTLGRSILQPLDCIEEQSRIGQTGGAQCLVLLCAAIAATAELASKLEVVQGKFVLPATAFMGLLPLGAFLAGFYCFAGVLYFICRRSLYAFSFDPLFCVCSVSVLPAALSAKLILLASGAAFSSVFSISVVIACGFWSAFLLWYGIFECLEHYREKPKYMYASAGPLAAAAAVICILAFGSHQVPDHKDATMRRHIANSGVASRPMLEEGGVTALKALQFSAEITPAAVREVSQPARANTARNNAMKDGSQGTWCSGKGCKK